MTGPSVIFIDADRNARRIAAPRSGMSVMQIAVSNGIDAIIGECGGNLSCATCHAYVGERWLDRIPRAEIQEIAMLGCAHDILSNSRLMCQIVVTDCLNGIEIELPGKQR